MDKIRLSYLQNRIAYARDQAAYKELYLYFHPIVYKLAATIVGQQSLAEEIVSDVMIRIWTMENKLAYVDRLKPYVFAATKNTAISYMRKYKAEEPLEMNESQEKQAFIETPDQQMVTLELSQIIERTIVSLPLKPQLTYRLIKEEGLTYKEACQVLEISQKTLEAHMCTALKKLRQTLDTYLLKKKP